MNGPASHLPGNTSLPLAAGLRRPPLMIFLHWATLVLVLLAVGIVLTREGVEEKALRSVLINLHRSVGLAIGLLTVARLFVRLKNRPLPPTAAVSPFARLAAGTLHGALYLLLLALPLLGWVLSSANGKPVSFFGLVMLPALVAPDEDLGDAFAEYHEEGAWLLLGLVGVHAAAALHHHFVRRDDVLRAMLPGRSR